MNAMIRVGNDDKELVEEAATELVELTNRLIDDGVTLAFMRFKK